MTQHCPVVQGEALCCTVYPTTFQSANTQTVLTCSLLFSEVADEGEQIITARAAEGLWSTPAYRHQHKAELSAQSYALILDVYKRLDGMLTVIKLSVTRTYNPSPK
jgi:hypothetical protein